MKKHDTPIKYYDIRDDLKAYPDAWAYLIWSRRGPGKTYSALRMMIEDKTKFLFMKRTIEDVKMLCADGGKRGVEFDISPFKPLNRDFGYNIKPVLIVKGIAGFYNCNDEGKPAGAPIGYCGALSAAKDIKGFDMTEVDYLIFDEFIPKRSERVNRKEGEDLLDIYMTLRRDRIERGLGDLKLICLANATSVNNPTFQTFDVVDLAVQMDIDNREYTYIQERGILLHKIPPVEGLPIKKNGIEAAMAGTPWADMAFGGSFAFDDFTSVKRQRMKGFKPICAYIYRNKEVFVYNNSGVWYLSRSKADVKDVYDLKRENEQKRFYYDYVDRIRDACIVDRCKFEDFTMYDLIVNYRKIFQI